MINIWYFQKIDCAKIFKRIHMNNNILSINNNNKKYFFIVQKYLQKINYNSSKYNKYNNIYKLMIIYI